MPKDLKEMLINKKDIVPYTLWLSCRLSRRPSSSVHPSFVRSSSHVWSISSCNVAGHVSSARSNPKDKQRQKDKKEGSVSPVRSKTKDKQQKKDKNEGKRHKGGSSGLLAPIPLSDELVKFIGTGENTLSRSDVVKRMWDYIKQNNLQDPSNKRTIICDEKLKELLKVDSFNGFGVSKLLASHFIKTKQ